MFARSLLWTFASMFISDIGIILLLCDIFGFGIRMMVASWNEFGSVTLCKFWAYLRSIGIVVSVHSFHCVRLFATLWTAACQVALSFTISQCLLKLTSIELVMPSNHLTLCHPLILLPSISPGSGYFPMIGSSHQMSKVLELQHQSFQFNIQV